MCLNFSSNAWKSSLIKMALLAHSYTVTWGDAERVLYSLLGKCCFSTLIIIPVLFPYLIGQAHSHIPPSFLHIWTKAIVHSVSELGPHSARIKYKLEIWHRRIHRYNPLSKHHVPVIMLKSSVWRGPFIKALTPYLIVLTILIKREFQFAMINNWTFFEIIGPLTMLYPVQSERNDRICLQSNELISAKRASFVLQHLLKLIFHQCEYVPRWHNFYRGAEREKCLW